MGSVYEILAATQYGVLSTVASNNTPWGVPVRFAFDEDAIYFRSSPDASHSKNIEIDPNVAFTIFDSSQSTKGAIYIHSKAEKLNEDEEQRAINQFNQRFDNPPNQWSRTYYFKVAMGTIDRQKSTERMYYFRSVQHEG